MDTPDHFFLLNTKKDQLYRINDQGEIQESLDLMVSEESKLFDLQPFTENNHPIIKFNNNLVIPGRFSNFSSIQDFTQLPVLLFVNIDPLSNPVWKFGLPEIFNQNFYSFHNYPYEPTYCFHFDHKNLLVSWPVSANIYSMNQKQIALAGAPISPALGPTTPPMSNNFSDYHKAIDDFKPHDKYTITTDCYHKLIRLSSDFILREVYDRPGIEGFNKRKYMPESRFMIINRNFENVGETTLPKWYLFDIYFVNTKGLHLARSSEDESTLSFTIFQIPRK